LDVRSIGSSPAHESEAVRRSVTPSVVLFVGSQPEDLSAFCSTRSARWKVSPEIAGRLADLTQLEPLTVESWAARAFHG
jgi:hypothetical protein